MTPVATKLRLTEAAVRGMSVLGANALLQYLRTKGKPAVLQNGDGSTKSRVERLDFPNKTLQRNRSKHL